MDLGAIAFIGVGVFILLITFLIGGVTDAGWGKRKYYFDSEGRVRHDQENIGKETIYLALILIGIGLLIAVLS